MAEEQKSRVRVDQVIKETHDSVSLRLSSTTHPVVARSGQFLTLLIKKENGKELRRSYSLSSSPELGEDLTITIKRISNGEVSRWLTGQVQQGAMLEIAGASGMFVLPDKPERYNHYIFFAAGSGIVPIFSLIKTLLHLHQRTQLVLIYSNRNVADTIFYKELNQLRERFASRFEVHFLFSISADLNRSRLTPTLLEYYQSTFNTSDGNLIYYLCGPASYMRMIHFTLLSLGVSPDRIRREQFFVPTLPALPPPPDTRAHTVTLIVDQQPYKFSVQYPVTILKAARELNIPVSFSCEVGQCGTCVAKCLQGEVWMSRNEILLDEELAKGNILTCTGYPVHGDVVIKI